MNYMTIRYENLLTITIAFISFIIVLLAQIKIKASYAKYKRISNKNNLTGFDVARKILDNNDLSDVHIVEVSGNLTDHYDPTRKVVRLSSDIFHNTTIAALSVAAHECGHAIQDKENYVFMRIRTMLVPLVNFISYLGYIVIFITLIIGMTGYFYYGILLVVATIIFQLVTLPVEFDASRRALKEIDRLKLTSDGEKEGTKEVLTSAALTYVASAISQILSLIRLIIMLNNRDDR